MTNNPIFIIELGMSIKEKNIHNKLPESLSMEIDSPFFHNIKQDMKTQLGNNEIPKSIFKEKPIIKIVGCGGAGCNAINNIIQDIGHKLPPESFIAMNTDAQSLKSTKAAIHVPLGDNGLGAGSDPEVGYSAAKYSEVEIERAIAGADLVVIATGLGGGTGSGASPVVAEIAKKAGALVIAIATKPFDYEGQKRKNNARDAIEKLCCNADVTVPISNQLLFRITSEQTPFGEAFKMVDTVCSRFVEIIVDIIETTGIINVDFADIRSTIENKQYGGIGIGYGDADEAARKALSNPLLEFSSMRNATNALVHITGDVTLYDVSLVMHTMHQEMGEKVQIIHGTQISNEIFSGSDIFNYKTSEEIRNTSSKNIRVMMIATGLKQEANDTSTTSNSQASSTSSIQSNTSSTTEKISNAQTPKQEMYNEEKSRKEYFKLLKDKLIF